MITSIFLDLDETLCQCVRSLLTLHGEDIDAIDWPRGWYDLPSLLAMTDRQLWAPVERRGEAFWAALEKTPWADRLLHSVQRAKLPWCICSRVFSSDSLRGKQRWLRRYYGDDVAQRLVPVYPGVCKGLFAAPGKLLIDDCEENCDAWREAGGVAWTVPQQWNYTNDTIGDLLARLMQIKPS